MRWFFSSETSSLSMRTVLETQLLGKKQSACQPFLTSSHPSRLTEIIFHPEYDESGAGGLSYDVALIKLAGSADARFCLVYLKLYLYFCVFLSFFLLCQVPLARLSSFPGRRLHRRHGLDVR